MLYTPFVINDTEYKCRLSAEACVKLEKRFGKNPLEVILGNSFDLAPNLSDLLAIFHASLLKFHHGVKEEDVYAIYDDFIDSGKTFQDFSEFIIQLFKDGGYIPNEDTPEEGDEIKNE